MEFREGVQFSDNAHESQTLAQILEELHAKPNANGVILLPSAAGTTTGTTATTSTGTSTAATTDTAPAPVAINIAGDWYAVFKIIDNPNFDFVLIIGQVQDQCDVQMVDQWRAAMEKHFPHHNLTKDHRRQRRVSGSVRRRDSNSKTTIFSRVKLVSLLCTSSKLKGGIPFATRGNDGPGSHEDMAAHSWLQCGIWIQIEADVWKDSTMTKQIRVLRHSKLQ